MQKTYRQIERKWMDRQTQTEAWTDRQADEQMD